MELSGMRKGVGQRPCKSMKICRVSEKQQQLPPIHSLATLMGIVQSRGCDPGLTRKRSVAQPHLSSKPERLRLLYDLWWCLFCGSEHVKYSVYIQPNTLCFLLSPSPTCQSISVHQAAHPPPLSLILMEYGISHHVVHDKCIVMTLRLYRSLLRGPSASSYLRSQQE
jgi:hypothetical protein